MFQKAIPVWPENYEKEMNRLFGFYYKCSYDSALTLRIATAGKYRLFVNGVFAYQGPARCAHGYYRVDELAIPAGEHTHIAIEVLNYYTNSFSDLRQPGFIQMELLADGRVIAATGSDDFTAFHLTHKIQKMPRYSYQRPMCEGYILTQDSNAWRVGQVSPDALEVKISETENKNLIPRGIALEKYPVVYPKCTIAQGSAKLDYTPESFSGGRYVDEVGDPAKLELAGWRQEELEWPINYDLQRFQTEQYLEAEENTSFPFTEKKWELYEFSCNICGYICADFICTEPSEVYITFDEKLTDGEIACPSWAALNCIKLQLGAGVHHFQSIEPYGFKYLKILCTKGGFAVHNLSVIEVVCPYEITAEYQSEDAQLQAVYAAAIQSFRQNVVDIFMDCPTRERAGWLCDSFFMGITEAKLTGQNEIERAFLQNYLLPESFDGIPQGMVPMCYPADTLHGTYIPNWALWLILELNNYCQRNNDSQLCLAAKSRIDGILNWFSQFENEDGLLEKIEGTVFVGASRSNELTRDISFPTNMLYAKALQTVGQMYADSALLEKAERLMETVRSRSYNGEFFVDNEVYRDGKLVSSGECTETCQYYAFFTGVATKQSHKLLWNKLMTEFGPDRDASRQYSYVAPSNVFMGCYIRLELLRLDGQYEKIKQECKGYFYRMAKQTGTLWEYREGHTSRNHGFASYAAVLLLDAEK